MKEKEKKVFYSRLLLLKMHYDEMKFLIKKFSSASASLIQKFDTLLNFHDRLKRASVMLATVMFRNVRKVNRMFK